MKARFLAALRHVTPKRHRLAPVIPIVEPVRIGLALGGGFARGIAHAGVLSVFENHHIPIHCITGVSAGSIVAAAYASGASPSEIARAGCSMRFTDVARWSIGRMGFVVSERMQRFLQSLLKRYRFEEMRIPLGITATDLCSGESVNFRDSGDVFLPVRASCSYPGLFQPVHYGERLLVDGAMSVDAPASLARQLGANRVITVYLPGQGLDVAPTNMFQVVNRCFQILQARTEDSWRKHSDLVITPSVRSVQWDGFGSGPDLVEAGAEAALAALPAIEAWLASAPRIPAAAVLPLMPGSKPA
jgi:NTE family protein